MQRSQPFAEMMTPNRAGTGTVSNLIVYASIGIFLAAFWLTVALVIL